MANDCPLPPHSRVIAYLRVSGDVQKEHGTIVGQLDALETYIAEHQLSLTHPPFTDEAKPGSSVSPRDGFQQMLAFTQQEPRPCDGVIFWSWSRFARDQDDAHFYKADLRRRGYTLISLSDGIPVDSGLDYVLESLIHWKDQEYLKQLSLQTKRGLHLLAKHGYAPGGFPPRGYSSHHFEVEIGGKRRRVAQWVPDPEWAPVVRTVWEMRANGASYLDIIEKTGLYHSRNSLTTHFRNKTYLGYRRCGDLEIPDAHEPLIDQDLWDRVQATLYDRPSLGSAWSGMKHPQRVHSPHLLTGLVRCAYCGAAIIGRTCNTGRHRNWRFYECGTKNRQGRGSCEAKTIPALRIERAVMDAVYEDILNIDFLMPIVDEMNRELQCGQPSLTADHLQRRIRSLDQSIANLLDLAEKAGGTEDILTRLEERRRERVTARQQLRQLHVNRDHYRIDLAALGSLLEKYRALLLSPDIRDQQTVLRTVIDHLIVKPHNAEILCMLDRASVHHIPPAQWIINGSTLPLQVHAIAY